MDGELPPNNPIACATTSARSNAATVRARRGFELAAIRLILMQAVNVG
jgi:hypothetical protein